MRLVHPWLAELVAVPGAVDAVAEAIGRRGLEAVLAILAEFSPDEQLQLADLLERFVKGIDRARSASI